MIAEAALQLVKRQRSAQPATIKAIIGFWAPLYLLPLLAFDGLSQLSQSLYTLFLVVVLTITGALPLEVIALLPRVANAVILQPRQDLAVEVNERSDMAVMVGLLLLYVAVDVTPLWTRVSLWLLSWRGVRVKPLFGALMAVAFGASFFLPGSFVTLVLAAFINRTVHHMQSHIMEAHEDRATHRGTTQRQPLMSLSRAEARRGTLVRAELQKRASRVRRLSVDSTGISILKLQPASSGGMPLSEAEAPPPLAAEELSLAPHPPTQPVHTKTDTSTTVSATPLTVTSRQASVPASTAGTATASPTTLAVSSKAGRRSGSRSSPGGRHRRASKHPPRTASAAAFSPPTTVFKPLGQQLPRDKSVIADVTSQLIGAASPKPGHLPSRAVFTTVHKVLIVGVAYTSIVASECSFITGRTRAIIDSEFAKRGRTSPMTVTEFLFFMFPMSLVTSVIFWFYIYGVYLQQANKSMNQEYSLAAREYFLRKRKKLGAVTQPEMIAVLIFVAFLTSFAANATSQFHVSPVVTTYLLVVLVIGVPRELGNPFLSHPSLVWPILLTYLPWDMIIMRIGGMELAHLARMSEVSSWIIDKVLAGNIRKMSPFWGQLVLLSTTAVLSELDTTFGFGGRAVPDLLKLADDMEQHELYFMLPVVIQASYVLLMPYTRVALIFIHQYTDIEYTELLGLSVFVKVVSSICIIVFSNFVNLSLPPRRDLPKDVANTTSEAHLLY